MNLSALRAVPRRSWRGLGLSALLVCAFAFDPNLVAIALAVGLGYRLVAIFSPTLRGKGSVLSQSQRPISITRLFSSEGEADPESETNWSCVDRSYDFPAVRDKQQINPATGLFVDSDGGFDSAGHLYGENSHIRSWR